MTAMSAMPTMTMCLRTPHGFPMSGDDLPCSPMSRCQLPLSPITFRPRAVANPLQPSAPDRSLCVFLAGECPLESVVLRVFVHRPPHAIQQHRSLCVVFLGRPLIIVCLFKHLRIPWCTFFFSLLCIGVSSFPLPSFGGFVLIVASFVVLFFGRFSPFLTIVILLFHATP